MKEIKRSEVIMKRDSPLFHFGINYISLAKKLYPKLHWIALNPSLKSLIWAPFNELEKETSLIATGYHTCSLTKQPA